MDIKDDIPLQSQPSGLEHPFRQIIVKGSWHFVERYRCSLGLNIFKGIEAPCQRMDIDVL